MNQDYFLIPVQGCIYRRNATSLTWTVRELTRFDIGTDIYLTYKYNADGIRTQKYYVDAATHYSAAHDYYLDGSMIVGEKIIVNTIVGSNTTYQYYYYDADGGITGLEYNGTSYYFLKNIQGDVVKICDCTGAVVVDYKYDAWGNTISITGTLASSVGQKNPFRYRGYYFDTETGLYYLNSRYYDPQVKRFINTDDPANLGVYQGIGGCNLFMYRIGSPVINNKTDNVSKESIINVKPIKKYPVSTESVIFNNETEPPYDIITTTLAAFPYIVQLLSGSMTARESATVSGVFYGLLTPINITLHCINNKLTTGQKAIMVGYDIGTAVGGVALTYILTTIAVSNGWNPVGWGVGLITLAYVAVTWIGGDLIESGFERYNGYD